MGKREMYHDFGNRMNTRCFDFILTQDFLLNNQWIIILWLLLNRDRCDSNCFGITYGGHYSYYDPCIKDSKYCCNNDMYYIPQCGCKSCAPHYRNDSFCGDSYSNFWWILILLFFNNKNNRNKCLPKRANEDGNK